ncbi:hypothetical protein SDC9_181896 [bioreactor metagenome]|uniref:Uncharacterized protein n=1 Tax=bioreactor metagenome TaxID=1076179 RepID=A0A645HFE3_9ZZZZ
MLKEIDAHGFRRDLVIPNCLKCAAVGGVDQQYDQRDANAACQEDIQRRRKRCIRKRNLYVGEIEIVAHHVCAVGHRAKHVPLEDRADDLRKADGCDCQIVRLKAQHGKPDQRRKQSGGKPRADEAQEDACVKMDCSLIVFVDRLGKLHRRWHGEDGIGIRADEHKPGLSQREKARKAVE